LDREDLAAMQGAVRRGAITDGPIARCFEQDFSEFLGVPGAVVTNSGTSALVLAMAVLEIGPGDEVVLPTYTCLAVLNAVRQMGAVPRLADNTCDAAAMDYNATAASLRRVVDRRTRAIIVPHMFGVPAEIDAIARLGPPVIEDITLSLGARHAGRAVGAWGSVSVCSLHASKMMACGEGGILASATAGLCEKARWLNGWEAEQVAARLQQEVEPYRLRYNFHLSDIAAALGRSQLRKLTSMIARRRELARRYTARLSPLEHLGVPAVADRANVFHRYLVAVPEGRVPGVIRRFAAAGIEAGRGVFPPLHRYLRLAPEEYAGAERAVRTLVSIPLYPSLSDEEADVILDASEAILSDGAS
jgi:dTDP-4-amino-4,6-dideoxygalactose transaminase